MDWKEDIVGLIKAAAPMVGTAIAGPLGGTLAKSGVSAILSAFGLPDTATPADVKTAIETDPNAALKLKVAENDFLLKQKDQELEDIKLTLADIQSARQRQIDHEKATGKTDTNLYILTWVVVVGFFAVLIMNMVSAIPEGQNTTVSLLIGALIGGFTSVLSYFFGSSKGSSDKSKQIERMGDQKNKAKP